MMTNQILEEKNYEHPDYINQITEQREVSRTGEER
jgi:hypothetical protein